MFSGMSAQVLVVLLRNQHGLDAAAMRRQQLLLEPADRQHFAAQRDLAGHRDFGAHRNPGQRRHQRRAHRDACARTVLRRRAFGHVDVDVVLLVNIASMPSRSARARTTVSAAWIDSCITSPSWPVWISLPLPGTTVASMRQQIAADFGPRQTGDLADLVLLLGAAEVNLRTPR